MIDENDREKKILKRRTELVKACKNVQILTKNFVIRKLKYLPMQRRKQNKVIFLHLAK
jgi:hypothetical protein